MWDVPISTYSKSQAQWICLCLPSLLSCNAGFESQAHYLHFHYDLVDQFDHCLYLSLNFEIEPKIENKNSRGRPNFTNICKITINGGNKVPEDWPRASAEWYHTWPWHSLNCTREFVPQWTQVRHLNFFPFIQYDSTICQLNLPLDC